MANSTPITCVKGSRWSVLDKGFIELIDYMGSDADICDAARISYGKGTKSVSDNRTLIRYLMRHAHMTPFEMCEIKIGVKLPIDVSRQWVRHRTASINEYSTRYSEAIDDNHCTLSTEWRLQNTNNKQGSAGFIPKYTHQIDNYDPDSGMRSGVQLSEDEADFHRQARALYESRIKAGVAREQARKDLLLSNYTEWYWKCDLRNVLGFLKLRMDSHAQLEIRSYANIIGRSIVAELFPLTWEAFVDYELESIKLTRLDILAIQGEQLDKVFTNKREREEYIAKLEKLQLSIFDREK